MYTEINGWETAILVSAPKNLLVQGNIATFTLFPFRSGSTGGARSDTCQGPTPLAKSMPRPGCVLPDSRSRPAFTSTPLLLVAR